ncbi:MAG TPA: hypothetical protein VHO48_02500, partial [Anaerolineaceae bacterium]|nr:hypothetical protein [Anaerolineaceae bacterium]
MSGAMGTNSLPQEQQNTERLVLVIILLLIFMMAARTPVDTDLWWHLRAGEETLRTGLPVTVDHFSYTRAGQPWSNHSWLAQVILAGVFHLGGYLGLGLLVAVTVTATLGLVYVQMPGPGLLRAFILALVAVVSAPVWMPRPQIFSLLCFALTSYLLYLYIQRRLDRLWLLPLLFAMWANLHGGYPLGLALLVAAIAGLIFDRFSSKAAAFSWAEIRRLAAWTGVSLLSVLANPGGIQAWLIPFQTVSVGALQAFIQEWASPDFHQLSQQPFLWLLSLCLLALGLSARPIATGDLFALIGFTGLALMARRNFGPFALAAGPILARLIWPSLIP